MSDRRLAGRGVRAVGVVLAASAVAVSAGCAPHDGERKAAGRPDAAARPTPRPKDKPAPPPRTAAQFVARARQAMGAERGWTFTVSGSESATLRGQAPSAATYAATVHRTTAPVALQQTGTITTSKGERKPEAVYVVGGTGYVKEGADAWKKGALSDPGIANDVEDPLADLDAFAAYVRSAKVSRTGGGGGVRLQVDASGWHLSAARSRPALKRAVREVEPTLAQLRKAGVTAADGQITLTSFTEAWDLDEAHGYRVTAHRYAFTFLVPFQGSDITVKQEVRAGNEGVFDGSVALPAGAK